MLPNTAVLDITLVYPFDLLASNLLKYPVLTVK